MVMNAVAEPTSKEPYDDELDRDNKWPEDRSGRWTLRSLNDALLYSYMGRILQKGALLHKQRKGLRNDASLRRAESDGDTFDENGRPETETIGELSREDLYAPPSAMAAENLRSEFWSLWEKQRKSVRTGTPRQAFVSVLWQVAKPTYIPAGFCQLASLLSQCSVPLLVREVLIRLEENSGENFVREGLPIAFALFAVSIIDGVAMERQKFLAFQTGIVLKSSIINATYDQVLGLTPRGKIGLTTGETTNLAAIDAQKLFELTQEGHLIWSCPLAMVIVTVLLLLELGPSTLVGMSSMFILMPITQRVVLKMMRTRKKRVAETDRRVEATTAMLQSTKFTKLNHYEEKFLQRISESRRREVKLLRKELAILAITFFLTVVSPVLAGALTYATYVLIDDGNTLSASTTFTTLILFSALRFPISYAGKLMGKAAQGLQACQRFADFFDRESRPEITEIAPLFHLNKDTKDDIILEVVDGSFTVESSPSLIDDQIHNANGTAFTVSDIRLALRRSEILCVVGPVASGKSTLIQGLIGVNPSTSKTLNVKGKIAYASQTPFIMNATIRDNILFGNEYEEEIYERVLESCCLAPDLDQLGTSRDLTEIGERGVTLSGGQKQRVALARVAYSQPDCAIFDDPLSALDSATAKAVFEKLFKADDSVLKKSAIVLVTHASHLLHRADQILVLVDGQTAFIGKWDALASCQPSTPAAGEVISALQASVQEDHTGENAAKNTEEANDGPSGSELRSTGDLMTTEEREFGLSDWRTWLKWFKYAGGWFFVTITVLAIAVDRFFYVAAEWWLASWTQAETTSITRLGRDFPPQNEGRTAQYEYLTVYGIILLISFLAAAVRSQWLVQAGARCSNQLFTLMTAKVIRAPMSYFETTPMGRILNRFTYDIETLDVTLTQNMTMLMTASGWFLTGVILQSVILPWQIFALSFIIVIYWLLLLHYRKSAVDLQRLDAVSRSPVQAQLAEVLDGSSTIRAFQKVPYFSNIFRSSLDDNSSAMMNFMAAHRWLSVRIQLVGSCAVLFSTCIIVAFNDILMISPGIAGMLVIWSSMFTISLGFMVQAISESEASLTSVERVVSMTEVPQEKEFVTRDKSIFPSEAWPTSGDLSFDNVSLRYRPGLPLSLDGLSFSLQSGERCGVVGRTGAGKSTLSVALFRLVEIEKGEISLDGVDLAKIGLADVRGRKNGLYIIPQDPVLYSGTLRECLDPFRESTDDQVLEALEAVRVAKISERGLDALKDPVEEGGQNYSVGERQLLCLARAILAKPKVMVLDEATASVDAETDVFIQRMLRTRFRGTTLLTIAHRLNTIMDYDKILAMDNGRAAEFGSPQELLERGGLFSSLVDSTGKQSSANLRRLSSTINLSNHETGET